MRARLHKELLEVALARKVDKYRSIGVISASPLQ